MFAAAGTLRAQRWHWAQRVGKGPGTHAPGGIAVDKAGNSYVIGTFTGTMTFDKTTFKAGSTVALYLAKYSPTGALLWANSGTGSGSFASPAVSADTAGNVYITGGFTNTVSFGPTAMTSVGASDIFVVKFDREGNLIWNHRAGGPGADQGRGIAIDSSGDCILTGYFSDVARFDTVDVTSAGGTDLFVAKYNSFGLWRWTATSGGAYNDTGHAVGVDGNGNPYIAGGFADTTDFGGRQLVSAGGSDMVIARYNPNGVLQWALGAGGPADDHARNIAVDRYGNSYVTGDFRDSAAFGDVTLASAGSSDIFLIKLNSPGEVRWGARGGGDSSDAGYGVTVDAFGTSYITGSFRDTATFGDTGRLIDANRRGDLFVTAFDSDGRVQWNRQAGGRGADLGSWVVADRGNELRVTGSYADTATFGTFVLNDNGPRDVFVGKLGSELTITMKKLSDLAYCPGTPVAIDYTATGTYNSANVFTAQLSDSLGSFAAPLPIGLRAGSGSGQIAATIPITATPGHGYRIRIISSLPSVTGMDNGEDITINPVPVPVITPGGSVSICPGGTVTLDAGAGYRSYAWSTGAVTQTIVVSVAGNYTVTVTNAPGCPGTSLPVSVLIASAPAKPSITSIGNMLESSPADSYEWLRNDTLIPGANKRTYFAAENGIYRVRVRNMSGCETLSDPFHLVLSDVPAEGTGSAAIAIYPHPTSGIFTVAFDSPARGTLRMAVVDGLGREVMAWSDASPQGEYRRQVDIGTLPSGIYFLRIEDPAGRSLVREVVKR